MQAVVSGTTYCAVNSTAGHRRKFWVDGYLRFRPPTRGLTRYGESAYCFRMTTGLREFLAKREHELKVELARIQRELDELRAARAAIDGGTGKVAPSAGPAKPTHQEMILRVLDERPGGAKAEQVKDAIARTFGVDIPRPSISSKLSRMRRDGLVTLDEEKVWRSPRSSQLDPPPENGDVAASPEAEAEGTDTAPGLPELQSSPQGA
jgi:DNA-binding transcriptional ArsR family regulator